MKKKIVITALTAMLAASMVTPVYADNQPPIKWNVDAEQYTGKGDMVHDWAAQYKDELLAIPDESERYDRIFQIVTDYLSIQGDVSQVTTADDFRRGLGMCGIYSNCIAELCNLSGIESWKVSGYNGAGDAVVPHTWNLVKINGEYFYSDAMRADKFDEYEYCKKTKELWPTFTIDNTTEHWVADEYLTKFQQQVAEAQATDYSTWVDSSTIDWDNPQPTRTVVHYMGGRQVD